MGINKFTAFLCGYYLLIVVYWVGLQMSGVRDLPINLMYSFALNLLGFMGGVTGLIVSGHWGRLKSDVGRGIFLLSSGTVSWGIGGFFWSFYNFVLKLEVPYPSLADLGFFGAIPLWIMGIIFLSKATGAKFGFRKLRGQLYALLFPVISAIFSYYVLYVLARDSVIELNGGLLKIFLDFAYPLGDWIILTLAFIVWGLSLSFLGGKFKWPVIIILIGFVIMYFADFSFSYTTTIGSYFNGNYSDLLFATALFVISLGVASLDPRE